MKKILIIVGCILACLLVGFISSQLQMEALQYWYPTLNKSHLTPPNIAFPIAWTTLYILMGISLGLIIITSHPLKKLLITLFVAQLIINFLWSVAFFYLQNPLLGLIDIILLDILVTYYIIKTYPVNKWSANLFIPYLIWIIFASYLNLYIYLNN